MEEREIIKGIFSGLSRAQITVTDKRVFGKTGFGKVVDVPINEIYRVSNGDGGSTVSVFTASKVYQFLLMKNGKEVYNSINELVANKPKDENDTAVFRCSTGLNSITVYEDCFVIGQPSTAVNLLVSRTVFEQEKKIYYGNISSVEFGEPSALAAGKLQFEFAGGMNYPNNLIYFDKKDRDTMRKIYEYIDEKVREAKKGNTQAVGTLSTADELKKFKELLDSGIITQEEFDAKKKQLLGL